MADVSVRAEARKALAQFARLYPKEQRGQVVDIVSAYGVRCILNEVALEQLSPARLAEACEDAISELPPKMTAAAPVTKDASFKATADAPAADESGEDSS